MITDGKTFCPLPWTQLIFKPIGGVGVCSFSPKIGNIVETPIQEIINSNTINEIKQAIKNGEWHKNCNYCQHSELHGGDSQRITELKCMTDDTKQKINQEVDAFKDIVLNWETDCNLSCNYCGPQLSSTWRQKKGIKLVPVEIAQEEQAVSVTMDYLISRHNDIDRILLLGGEPLMQKNLVKFFENLPANKKYRVTIATNLSVNLKKNPLFKLMLKSKNLGINWLISFDNIGDQFEYVRDGASWEIFENNIKILKENTEYDIAAHLTYSLYCVDSLKEYYDYCTKNNLRIEVGNLSTPVELNVTNAPKEIRMRAIEEIDQILISYNNDDISLDILRNYKSMLEKAVPYKSGGDKDYIKAQNILNFNSRLETELNKNKKFEDLWPELHNILKKVQND